MKKQLIRFLELSKSKDSEVALDAIRKANKLLRMCGTTWETLLEETDPKKDFYKLTLAEAFAFCQAESRSVNSRQFSRDLEKAHKMQGFLTPSQTECLLNIYTEARRPKAKTKAKK